MSEVMHVPEGWKVESFSKIAKINMGQSPDSLYVNENQEGMAFLQGNADFGEKNPKECYWVTQPKKISIKGDILISVRAPVGDMNIADKKYCIGRGLASLTINKINPSYGSYALSQEKRQLDRLAQGSTFLAINKNDFDVLKVKYPLDSKEQQKIAKILSTLDKTIEASQKLIAKEKNIKKGLMHDLLTNGIDADGKIRSPQTHRYKESELGLIPEEWEVKPFSNLAKVNMGQSPESVYVNENQNGMAFLQGNADFGDMYPKECYWVTQPKKIAQKGDVLISVRAPVGDMNVADKEYCIGRGLASLTINKINSAYGYYALYHERKQLDRVSQGSTFLAMSKNDFDILKIKYPIDKNEQRNLAHILIKQDKKIETEENNLSKLKKLKKGLMSDLLSGRVRVEV